MTAAPFPSLTQSQFREIARIAEREAGLFLEPQKASMVQARLARRLRATGTETYASYLEKISEDENTLERQAMIGALTTNVTQFFRELHHFEFFRTNVVPKALHKARRGMPVKIWSAGSSTGQEAFSIAMTFAEEAEDFDELNIKILATDICSTVLQTAEEGLFSRAQMSGLSPRQMFRFFEQTEPEGPQERYQISQSLRNKVTFQRQNLLSSLPEQAPFDAVFCRNVVIYFKHSNLAPIWQKLRDGLVEDGHLFLGHSERIEDATTYRFRAVGNTVYQSLTPQAARKFQPDRIA